MIVDPGTGGVLSCVLETETQSGIRLRNKRQKTRAESDKQEQKTRVTQRVQSEEEITRERITSVPIPETSQNIIFSSHKFADMP